MYVALYLVTAGSDVGEAIARHTRQPVVSFNGSTKLGRSLVGRQ